MRNRNIDKHLWLNRDEAQTLQKKAKKACVSESQLLRMLIYDDFPKEKPDDRFYDYLNVLKNIDTSLERLANEAYKCSFSDTPQILYELNENRKFRLMMMKKYLNSDKYE